jgi:hypothetical protein
LQIVYWRRIYRQRLLFFIDPILCNFNTIDFRANFICFTVSFKRSIRNTIKAPKNVAVLGISHDPASARVRYQGSAPTSPPLLLRTTEKSSNHDVKQHLENLLSLLCYSEELSGTSIKMCDSEGSGDVNGFLRVVLDSVLFNFEEWVKRLVDLIP